MGARLNMPVICVNYSFIHSFSQSVVGLFASAVLPITHLIKYILTNSIARQVRCKSLRYKTIYCFSFEVPLMRLKKVLRKL